MRSLRRPAFSCVFLRFSAFSAFFTCTYLVLHSVLEVCKNMTSTADPPPATPSADDAQPKNLFEDISADNVFSEIESLCMNCHEQGITRLLLTRVPFFKEIIVMAFSCPHCGYESNEIQSGSAIQEKGVRYVLSVQTRKVHSLSLLQYTCTTLLSHIFIHY